MDSECKAESGLQLLARLSSRPSLHSLNDRLFPEGLTLGDTVEITGDLSSGKTILITQLLAKCLLPKAWRGTYIGGLSAGAIILNTDHHFQMLKLVGLMESSLMKINNSTLEPTSSTVSDMGNLSTETVEKIIKEALTNLIVLNCYDRAQLIVTVHSLGNILSSNRNVSLLVLDNISAYYWQDTAITGICKMEVYLKKTLRTLQSSLQEHRIAIIYTRQAHFQSKIGFAANSNRRSGEANITHKIVLNRIEGRETQSFFFAEVNTSNSRHTIKYTITGEGLIWAS